MSPNQTVLSVIPPLALQEEMVVTDAFVAETGSSKQLRAGRIVRQRPRHDPVKTDFGWHLILPVKKTPAVEAKGDKPAAPEKVQASHILLMARDSEKAPTRADIEKRLREREESSARRAFFDKLRAAATIESTKYPELAAKPGEKPAAKSAVKPAEKPAVKPAVKPAEKPAAKPAEKTSAKSEAK